MNDIERQGWVMNDESLYSWWRGAGQGISAFVRENRAILTEYIQKALNKEPRS